MSDGTEQGRVQGRAGARACCHRRVSHAAAVFVALSLAGTSVGLVPRHTLAQSPSDVPAGTEPAPSVASATESRRDSASAVTPVRSAVTDPSSSAASTKTAPKPAKALGTRDARDASAWSLWSAVGRNAPLHTRVGHAYDRGLYMLGIGWQRTLVRGHGVSLAYTLDVLPVVVSTHMPTYHDTVIVIPPCGGVTPCPFTRSVRRRMIAMKPTTVYGFGATPVGLRVGVGPRRAQLLIGATGGLIYFRHAIPDPGETQLNFTADGSALVRVAFGNAQSVIAGFHYNHISNGGRGPINPGMNTPLWRVGWQSSLP